MQNQDITIITTHGEYEFIGKHLPEMEKPNWHYYEAAEAGRCEFGRIVKRRESNLVLS